MMSLFAYLLRGPQLLGQESSETNVRRPWLAAARRLVEIFSIIYLNMAPRETGLDVETIDRVSCLSS